VTLTTDLGTNPDSDRVMANKHPRLVPASSMSIRRISIGTFPADLLVPSPGNRPHVVTPMQMAGVQVLRANSSGCSNR
jgi:hypothetical protein